MSFAQTFIVKNQLAKKIAGAFLALTIVTSGSAIVQTNVNTAHAASAKTKANRIISTARHYLGTPYRFGASTKTTRVFDCSSFTKYVYKKNGIYLPRVSRNQAHRGYHVARRNLKKGDLVFFYTKGSGKGHVGHVAIYAGNGKIIHTYGKPGVTYSNLNSKYWSSRYITARRVIR